MRRARTDRTGDRDRTTARAGGNAARANGGPDHPASVLRDRVGNSAIQRLVASGAVPRSDEYEREAERAVDEALGPGGTSGRTTAAAHDEGASDRTARTGSRDSGGERSAPPGTGRDGTGPALSSVTGSAGVRADRIGTAAGGRPLPGSVRSYFEERLGRGFGDVRVHADDRSAAASRELGARAFTYGREIFFGEGEYRPATSDGRRLLAHELAHTVQQEGAARRVVQRRPVDDRGDRPRSLGETLDPGALSERELEAEIRRIREWLVAHPVSSETTLRLRGALSALEAEVGARTADDPGPRRDEPEASGAAGRDEVPRAAEEPGFWATVGGGLMGEFEEDPSFEMIGVDLGVSLIPILDQVSDARDVVAHLYYLIFEGQYDRFMRWIGLAFTLIGLIPEVGSAIKGASKFVIKALREGASYLTEVLRPFRRLLPGRVDVRRLGEYVRRNWNDWTATAMDAWDRILGRIRTVVEDVPTMVSRQVETLQDGLARVGEMAPRKLREAFEWARLQWDDFVRRFGGDGGPGRLLWGHWSDYPKVTRGGREYARIGDHLYTRHAVNRMQPRGLGRHASERVPDAPQYRRGAGLAGRSISPTFVEEVLRTGTARLQTRGDQIRRIYESGSVTVVTDRTGEIVITVVTR